MVGLRTDREYTQPRLFLCWPALTHCAETNNELSEDDSYEHISVMQNIGQYVLLDEQPGCLLKSFKDAHARLAEAS